MRIFVDSADPAEIEEWDAHPWVSGFTTNPTLFKAAEAGDYLAHAKMLVRLTEKCISIDGPSVVWDLGEHVWRKTTNNALWGTKRWNRTAICIAEQCRIVGLERLDIISVFAGRIMDTGRDPQPVIDAAKVTGAQVLWASVREPYNLIQAEQAGCDIVTVPPVILRKYLEWHGKPLEVVAQETIRQFKQDSQWT